MKEIKGKTALGVLEILKKERHCSGESMAAKLGVSRASAHDGRKSHTMK